MTAYAMRISDWSSDVCSSDLFADAYGAIPFPIPQNGVEALWNHIARYRGSYIVRRASEVAVQRNGSYSLVTSQQEAMFKFYRSDESRVGTECGRTCRSRWSPFH